MDSQKSGKFFVGSFIIFLIIFGLSKVILATMQDVADHAVAPESMAAAAIEKRIKPVAQEYVGTAPAAAKPAAPAAATKTETASAGGKGKQIVTQICSMCHRTGMMNAPKLGNKDDWAPRIEKGKETLYDHAMNGFNMMPARGGHPDLSDEDVKAAVDYMLSLVK